MKAAGYESPVLFRLPKIVLVVALSLSLGLHWALLQSVAWVGMVVSYSQSAPIAEALAKTFDGKHPCKLCKLVDAGKQTEQKQESQKTSAKVEFFFVSSPLMLHAPVLDLLPVFSFRLITTRGESPPTPPPRILPG